MIPIRPSFGLLILALVAALQVLVGPAHAAEPVKMSNAAICHCPGGAYYGRTRHFRAFDTIEACLASGGRPPKRGQGNCMISRSAPNEGPIIPPSTTIDAHIARPYDRGAFGGWADLDGNCRDTRDEVLAELSTGLTETSPNGCQITHGRWNDPYTGLIFTNPGDMDIDHVVPLNYAWARGAADWPAEKRIRFANDPANLIATDARTNRQKSSDGPLDWLPPNEAFRCQYVLRFQRITLRYDLAPADREATALHDLERIICG